MDRVTLVEKARPYRVTVARVLLVAAKAVAPITLHAEAREPGSGRQVALLAVGSNVGDIGGLLIESATRLVGSMTDHDDEDDEGDW